MDSETEDNMISFNADCRRFDISPQTFHPNFNPRPVLFSDDESEEQIRNNACITRNQRYNGDDALRNLNSNRGRINCTSLCIQTLLKFIKKEHSLVLNISDSADTQLPFLMTESHPDLPHSLYIECKEDGSIPGLGAPFTKDMFQKCNAVTEESEDQLRDLKGHTINIRSLLQRCDLQNAATVDIQINEAIINALSDVDTNNHGMIIGLLSIAWKEHESESLKHHLMLFSIYHRKYLTITEPQHFQGGATQIKAEYRGLWDWKKQHGDRWYFVDLFPLSRSVPIKWEPLLGDLFFDGLLSTDTVDKFNAEMLLLFFERYAPNTVSILEPADSAQLSDRQKLELFADFLCKSNIIIPNGGALQSMKEFFVEFASFDSHELMHVLFSMVADKTITEDADHAEALAIYIFQSLRSCCIKSSIQGTVPLLYRSVHRNALLRQQVLDLHHNHESQRFKVKAAALYQQIRTRYSISVSASKVATNILLNTDYIVSVINDVRVLLIRHSANPKMCADLGMTVPDALGFDLARYFDRDRSVFDVPSAAMCFKFQPQSLNRMLRNMFDVLTPKTIIKKHCVPVDYFFNSFIAAVANGNLDDDFAFRTSFDRFD